MTPPLDCPLVIISWLDSRQPSPSWRYLADIGDQVAVSCATVGWLLIDNDDVKVVCQSVGDLDDPDNAQAGGVMTIPTRCVTSVKRLEEVELIALPTASCDRDAACSQTRRAT